MRFAVAMMSVAALAIGLFAARAEARVRKVEHPTHNGTVVSATGGKLIMTGRGGKEHTHAMAKDAKITIDGKAGTLAGLKKGMHVTVTTDAKGNATAVSTVSAPAVTPTTPAGTVPAKTSPAKTPAASVAPAKTTTPTPAKSVGK